jgi:hypothetical protein
MRNLDKIGLINSVIGSVFSIDVGRRGLRTTGQEANGKINFDEGMSGSINAFTAAHDAGSVELLLLAELTFLSQEIAYCEPSDTPTISSLTQAVQSFNDALLALEVVDKPEIYKGADKTYPHNAKYRFGGMPKDALHIACNAHQNIRPVSAAFSKTL